MSNMKSAFEKAGLSALTIKMRTAIDKLVAEGVTTAEIINYCHDITAKAASVLSGAPREQKPVGIPVAATKAARAATAKVLNGIFDRERTSTGKLWGNIRVAGLEGGKADGEVHAAILTFLATAGRLTKENMQKRIRDVISPPEFYQILRNLRGKNAL